MRKAIIGLLVATGAVTSFAIYCCVRVGTMYDRMNETIDEVDHTVDRVTDTVNCVNRIIGHTDADMEPTEYDPDFYGYDNSEEEEYPEEELLAEFRAEMAEADSR